MRTLLKALSLLSLCFMTSCMTSYKAYENKDITDALVGMSQDAIIESLGAPADIVNYLNGSILIYEGNEIAFNYNHPSRKVANPKLEVFCDNNDICTSTRVSQMEKVKKFSTGKTILLLLSAGILGML